MRFPQAGKKALAAVGVEMDVSAEAADAIEFESSRDRDDSVRAAKAGTVKSKPWNQTKCGGTCKEPRSGANVVNRETYKVQAVANGSPVNWTMAMSMYLRANGKTDSRAF